MAKTVEYEKGDRIEFYNYAHVRIDAVVVRVAVESIGGEAVVYLNVAGPDVRTECWGIGQKDFDKFLKKTGREAPVFHGKA